MKVIKWWKLSSGESYQVMKVIKWWKLSCNESFLVMKLIWWWKLYSDESYLVMKVKEVEIVLKSDGSWRFACGDVFYWCLPKGLWFWNSGYEVSLDSPLKREGCQRTDQHSCHGRIIWTLFMVLWHYHTMIFYDMEKQLEHCSWDYECHFHTWKLWT